MTSTAAPIETGQTVVFQGRRWTVAFLTYNDRRPCPHCSTWCNRADLDADGTVELGVRVCQLTPAPAGMTEGEMRQRHATHATITITYVGGPERLYRVAASYAGTAREVDGLTYGAADYDRAARLGNALVDLFNTITIATALDALPKMTAVLNLAA